MGLGKAPRGRTRAGTALGAVGSRAERGALLSRSGAGRGLLVLRSLVPRRSAHSSLVGWREGAEADVPVHQERGTDGDRLRHPHLCRAWAGAARAGGSGVMPCSSLSCWRCRRGSLPLRDFSEGSVLGDQSPARGSKPTSGWALAPPPQHQPETPEPGGAGAALSPVPGGALLGAAGR